MAQTIVGSWGGVRFLIGKPKTAVGTEGRKEGMDLDTSSL
jgi:hypothetical protein